MQDYINWLKNYFSKKNILPDSVEKLNYYEAGLIDSLGTIELIETIESEFNIRFEQKNFQDRKFSTIIGLAEIIHQLKLKELK